MKILYVVKNMRISNGVSSFIMNYYRELIKNKNIEIDFLIISDVGSPYYDEIKKNRGKIFLMPSLKRPLKVLSFLNDLFKSNKYDILHSNVFNSGFIVAYYAKKYGTKVRILHSHATSNGDTTIKKIRNYPFQLLNIALSNEYFACSKLAGDRIFLSKNFHIIPNAIDLEKYKYSKKTRDLIRLKKSISNDTLVVGVVGRITKQKNPYFILNIAKGLKEKNIDFNILWLGSGDMDKEIYETSKEMGLSN